MVTKDDYRRCSGFNVTFSRLGNGAVAVEGETDMNLLKPFFKICPVPLFGKTKVIESIEWNRGKNKKVYGIVDRDDNRQYNQYIVITDKSDMEMTLAATRGINERIKNKYFNDDINIYTSNNIIEFIGRKIKIMYFLGKLLYEKRRTPDDIRRKEQLWDYSKYNLYFHIDGRNNEINIENVTKKYYDLNYANSICQEIRQTANIGQCNYFMNCNGHHFVNYLYYLLINKGKNEFRSISFERFVYDLHELYKHNDFKETRIFDGLKSQVEVELPNNSIFSQDMLNCLD